METIVRGRVRSKRSLVRIVARLVIVRVNAGLMEVAMSQIVLIGISRLELRRRRPILSLLASPKLMARSGSVVINLIREVMNDYLMVNMTWWIYFLVLMYTVVHLPLIPNLTGYVIVVVLSSWPAAKIGSSTLSHSISFVERLIASAASKYLEKVPS